MVTGPRQRRSALFSLGSNQDAERHLASALAAFAQRFGAWHVVRSSTWRSAAQGFDGPDFLNLALRVETEATALDLRGFGRALEDAAGRDRTQPRFSSRPLDVDLLMLGSLVDDALGLPAPDLLTVDFVRVPVAEVAEGLCHPSDGRTLAGLEVLEVLAGEALRRVDPDPFVDSPVPRGGARA